MLIHKGYATKCPNRQVPWLLDNVELAIDNTVPAQLYERFNHVGDHTETFSYIITFSHN